MRNLISSSLLLTMLFGGSTTTLIAQEAADPLAGQSDIPNYYRLREDIVTAGQPTEQGFENLKEAGFTTIVNLRTEEEGAAEEKVQVENMGLTYYNIPIGRDGFTPEMIETFSEILESPDRGPLVIHCASSNRVGALWYLYQVLDAGEAPDAALAEGKKAGLTSEALEKRATDYIAQAQK